MRVAFFLLICAAAAAASDARLADAAQRGDRAKVASLLKQNAPVNGAQGDGATALHWAVYNDDLPLAKTLLEAGADIKGATRNGGITPLFMACMNGDPSMIELLLGAGADPNSSKANGTTALMMAAASGSTGAVKLLLDKGAAVDAKEAAHGQTALMFAANLNRAEVARALLARGANPNLATTVRKLARVRFDMDGNIVEENPAGAKAVPAASDSLDALARSLGFDSAIYRADTSAFDRAALDLLARSLGLSAAHYAPERPAQRSKAGDVASRGPRRIGADSLGGMTALLYAVREGHFETAQALLEGKADVNHVSEGEKTSPLVMAIMNGHYDVAKLLLEHGADPNLANKSGLAALYAVIDVQWAPKTWVPQPKTDQERTGYLDLMAALLDHGAKVNAQLGEKLWFRSYTNDYTWVDPTGATPLWRAAQSSDIEAMKLLVAHGADPSIKTKDGETVLMAAAGIGWAGNWSVNAPYPALDSVKYAVELGNDVNLADLRGYTALHGAAYLGNDEMVKYLVSKGAKVDVKSKAGDTVADMANGPTRFGIPHPATVALLENLGSANSHNCRSDQCVIAAKANIYDRRTPADYAQSEQMDAFAKSVGFENAEYKADLKRAAASAASAPGTPASKPNPDR